MKYPFRSHILPYFTLAAGALGFALQCWLFSCMDEKGLLPVNHPASIILYILTAVTIAVLFLSTRHLTPRRVNKKAIRLLSASAYLTGGAGFLFTAVSLFGAGTKLNLAAAVAALISSLTMLYLAALKYFRKRLPYQAAAVITIALMLITVAQCRIWGTIPQLQEYFFPLMASVFLILTAYHNTACLAKQADSTLLAFFSQGALFFCFLSLNSSRWPLYLGLLCWAAVQIFPCIRAKKEM